MKISLARLYTSLQSVQQFYISPKILGTESFLQVSPDGFSTHQKVPVDSWLFSGEYKIDRYKCVDTLCRLANVNVSSRPEPKWINMMTILGHGETPPWSQVMPQSQYKKYVKNIVKSVIENHRQLPEEYYVNTWMQCDPLFKSLRPARVDGVLHKSLMDNEGIHNGSLETFKPGPGGFAPQVVYDRFGTRTGRLTVESGPNILVLKKEHRSILRSYYPQGEIVSLDFSSLEARVLLAEAQQHLTGDVYQHMSNDIFQGKVSRSAIKTAVLGELYGASKATLGYKLDMAGLDLDRFIAIIKSYFKTDEIKSRLKQQFEDEGMLRNRFGRPLFIDSKNSDYLLINTYAQSTGVDISLLGFNSIVNLLGNDGVRPLFILHDALILDVRNDRIQDVKSLTSVKIPGYEHEFPLKFEMNIPSQHCMVNICP